MNSTLDIDRLAGANGSRKPGADRSRKAGADRSRKPRNGHVAAVQAWAQRYVAVACVLSSGLNAYANTQLTTADDTVSQCAAGLLGAVVPVLVWLCFKTAGHAYRGRRVRTAYSVGAAGTALLLLSVWHCAHAIAQLTGCGMVLSTLMALGVDYGLVANEVAAISSTQE